MNILAASVAAGIGENERTKGNDRETRVSMANRLLIVFVFVWLLGGNASVEGSDITVLNQT